MRREWPLALLAAGLAALHIATSLVFGAAVASAIIAGIGFGYAGFNFLLGRRSNDEGATATIFRVLRVTPVTWAAILLVWLSAVGIALVPRTREAMKESFTVTVVDELHNPVADAFVAVRFDGGRRAIPVVHDGLAVIEYYPGLGAKEAEIVVDAKGVRHTLVKKASPNGRFPDVVVPVWSGRKVLAVSHLTVKGGAIGTILKGELPPDLADDFPRVRVIPNAVFKRAAAYVSLYDAETPQHIHYSRIDAKDGGRTGKPALRLLGETPASSRYERAIRGARYAAPLDVHVGLDLSTDVLGTPFERPLPAGFFGRVLGPGTLEESTLLVPDAAASAWLASKGIASAGPDGAVPMRIEHLVTAADLARLLRTPSPSPKTAMPQPVERIARYLIGHRVPPGMIGGRVDFGNPDACPDPFPPNMELLLPAPELRVTILKNTGNSPVTVDRLILTMAENADFRRREQRVPVEEREMPFDMIAPGEAVLVPRELSFTAYYSDDDLRIFNAPNGGPAATLRLWGSPAREDASSEAAFFHDYRLHPAAVLVPPGRLMVAPAARPASDEEDVAEPREPFKSNGPAYVLGPSVEEVDYVVGGVRLRARSDTHTFIATIGSWDGGSCPYVFARYDSGAAAINLGKIIRNQVGRRAKGTDQVHIAPGFGSIELRELEDEVSHIDAAALVVRGRAGTRHYRPLDPALRSIDGRERVLAKGQSLKLRFHNVAPIPRGSRILLQVNGYYVPGAWLRRQPAAAPVLRGY